MEAWRGWEEAGQSRSWVVETYDKRLFIKECAGLKETKEGW